MGAGKHSVYEDGMVKLPILEHVVIGAKSMCQGWVCLCGALDCPLGLVQQDTSTWVKHILVNDKPVLHDGEVVCLCHGNQQ